MEKTDKKTCEETTFETSKSTLFTCNTKPGPEELDEEKDDINFDRVDVTEKLGSGDKPCETNEP